MISIRTIQKTDISDCAALMARSRFFVSYGITEERVRSWLRKGVNNPLADLEVAIVQDSVVGFSWTMSDGAFGRSPYLRLLSVDDDFHRQGIGRKLMNSLEEKHKAKRDLFLLVTETNRKARTFYEGLGYEYIGLLKEYIKKDVNECLYRKVLSSLPD